MTEPVASESVPTSVGRVGLASRTDGRTDGLTKNWETERTSGTFRNAHTRVPDSDADEVHDEPDFERLWKYSIEAVRMSDDGMLPVDFPEPIPDETAGLSADRRRTLRQAKLVQAGVNPLRRTLHPFAAPEVCSPDAPKGQPFTCGSCRFREAVEYHGRSFPKCTADWWVDGQPGPHVSHSAGTDVRAWWPACDRYEAGDHGLSRDAARSIPGESS